jgi:hypothetical protein
MIRNLSFFEANVKTFGSIDACAICTHAMAQKFERNVVFAEVSICVESDYGGE